MCPPLPASSAVSRLQCARTNSTSTSREESTHDDGDMVNPLSYPGELEEGDGMTTYYGELQEGEERPHMLHAVWRIRSMRRKPWWEVDALNALGLEVSFYY